MTDLAQTHRFVYRDGAYLWIHQLEMEKGDVDVTDFNDEDFAEFVANARS